MSFTFKTDSGGQEVDRQLFDDSGLTDAYTLADGGNVESRPFLEGSLGVTERRIADQVQKAGRIHGKLECDRRRDLSLL